MPTIARRLTASSEGVPGSAVQAEIRRPVSAGPWHGLDRIDEIVPPGITLNPADNGWVSPALHASARRR